jgi:hypothetical protein
MIAATRGPFGYGTNCRYKELILSSCLNFGFYLSVTFPLMLNTTISFLALEITVIVFRNVPGMWVLYFTFITPVLPAGMGAFDHSGVVHPQEALTLLSTRVAFPALRNLNSQCAGLPTGNSPKSYRVFSKTSSACRTGCFFWADTLTLAIKKARSIIFIDLIGYMRS